MLKTLFSRWHQLYKWKLRTFCSNCRIAHRPCQWNIEPKSHQTLYMNIKFLPVFNVLAFLQRLSSLNYNPLLCKVHTMTTSLQWDLWYFWRRQQLWNAICTLAFHIVSVLDVNNSVNCNYIIWRGANLCETLSNQIVPVCHVLCICISMAACHAVSLYHQTMCTCNWTGLNMQVDLENYKKLLLNMLNQS